MDAAFANTNSPIVYALVPAAGNGSRLGLGYSKALLRLREKALIQYTLDALLAVKIIKHCVVIIREEDRESFDALALNDSRISFTVGGSQRQESVRRGLDFLSVRFGDLGDSLILVHDAARCLIRREIVADSIAAAQHYGAVTVAIPLIDSVKAVKSDGQVEASLDRSRLVNVQTPQVFRYELLQKAHSLSVDGATDDASLVEQFAPVYVVPGERANIKVTTPEDLLFAEAILAARERS